MTKGRKSPLPEWGESPPAAEQGVGASGGATGPGVNWRAMLGRHGAGGFLRHGLSAAGGAMAGVMLVANAYRDAQENAKKLVEIEQSYSKAIREANKAPLTARGERSRQAFDILTAEIDKSMT